MAKQGWKQGDQSKGDYNVENGVRERRTRWLSITTPTTRKRRVLNFGVLVERVRFENVPGRNVRGETSKGIFQPSQERFFVSSRSRTTHATKMCEKKTIELKEKGEETKTLTVKVHAAKYANAKVQKWRIKVREKKALDLKPHRKDRAGESLGAERLRRQGRIERVKTNNGGKVNISIHPEKHNERMNARLSSARSDDELCRRSVRAVLFLYLFIYHFYSSSSSQE